MVNAVPYDELNTEQMKQKKTNKQTSLKDTLCTQIMNTDNNNQKKKRQIRRRGRKKMRMKSLGNLI